MPTAPPTRTLYCERHGVDSELDRKRQARTAGELTWHAHIGLADWPATVNALHVVHEGLAAAGHALDRFGLCLSRAMSLPASERAGMAKETGPLLTASDWAALGRVVPVQPHLGDHMIGTPAGLESTELALAAGITTIGNLGQYLAFDLPGLDEPALACTTAAAVARLARDPGGLLHSYLDDGPAMQLAHLGSYVGWAALERWVVEDVCGARLAHCYGGLVPDPFHRMVVGFALALLSPDAVGSMIYGDTVSYRPGDPRNADAMARSVEVDVLTQRERPSGHAINPVPLTEAERIPSAEEILAVQLAAREIAATAPSRRAEHDIDGAWRAARLVVEHAHRFRTAAVAHFASSGVDVSRPEAVLLALRGTDARRMEDDLALETDPAVAALTLWKAGRVAELATVLHGTLPPLQGTRIVLAALEVHDVVRDGLARALPAAGAEVVVLPKDGTPAAVAAAASDEDADVVIVATYNGAAATLGRALVGELRRRHCDATVVFGGVLNEDRGGALPDDARPELRALGVRCVDRLEELAPVLAACARHRP